MKSPTRLAFVFFATSSFAVAACSQVLGVDWSAAHAEAGGAGGATVSTSPSTTSTAPTSSSASVSSSSSSAGGGGGEGGACPIAKCSNACVDTTMDPMNCGYCGHACAGCKDGLCPPTKVTDDDDFVSPRYLAISNDDKQLWIVDDANQAQGAGALFELSLIPFDPSGIQSVWTGFDVPTDIALDAQYAYVVGRGSNGNGFFFYFNRAAVTYANSVYLGPVNDVLPFDADLFYTSTNTIFYSSGQIAAGHPRFLRANISSLFWIEDDPAKLSVQRVMRDDTPKTNGGAVELATGFVDVRSVAAGTDRLFVAIPELATGMGGPQVGAVLSIPIDDVDAGVAPTVVASNVLQPEDLTADSEAFYFTDSATPGVYRCPIAGCPNQTAVKLADAIDPTCIAVDSTSVYFCDQGDGSNMHKPTIYRVPR